MNIIAEAKARENKIHSNLDLLSAQQEMLETMLAHHAITPLHNEWTTRGEWIQATFWELKKDYIRHI